MPTPVHELIGREDELAAIDRLLESPALLPGALLLHGEAGIGKTSLWLAGVDTARASGHRVLSSRPSEAETRLSYAGLSDLLGGVIDDVLPELPPIQRRALEAALLLGEERASADERAVAAAFRSSLELLVGDGQLCLAVDDLQWLDAASTAALRFVLARLDEQPLAVLLSARGEPPTWLRRSLPERLVTVDVHGLSVGALRELLLSRLEATFPRPTLLRVWETSGGNPFFALELARAIQRRGGAPAPGDPLPLPSTLDELLRERVESLGEDAIDVARIVAAAAEPTTVLVERALPRAADAGLSEALEAGIIELDGERLRFTHPLLGTAVESRQAPAGRRSLHALLATLVPTEEERARHLAVAAMEPDEELASLLEEAVRSAQSRGAPVAAAELAEQARRLTPPTEPDAARRRLFLAADGYYVAGDIDRAAALLDQARATAAPGMERADVLARLARVTMTPRAAVALYREALSEASDDALKAEIHLCLAPLMRFTDGVERGIEHGELAVRAASKVDDVSLRCRAVAAYGLLHFNGGRGIPSEEMEEALRLERTLDEWPLEAGPAMVSGHQLWWSAQVDRARPIYREIEDAARERNAWHESEANWCLGFLEWRAGNWADADRYATRSLELSTQLGVDTPNYVLPAVVIAAHRGRVDDARVRARAAVVRAEAEGMDVAVSGFSWVLGFVELSLGDPGAALPHLRRTYELRRDFIREPAMRLELGDHLETLVATGALDEAEEILAVDEPRATVLDRSWALAILARSRGLLLAARGDLEGAFASFERALLEHARTTDPFHHARTLLALGRTQRRAKRRGDARTTLEDALARFERLGAPLWAEQTRTELARIGGRAASDGALTDAESRIAALVAQGHTNREVAAALFLTPHSVETALTRIYRKLGVRSRTELARRYPAKT